MKPSVAFWDRLRARWLQARDAGEEDGVAVALAACATKKQFDDLIEFLSVEERGEVGSLRQALSPAERAAMDAEPSLTSRMLGQAVHRRTADALEEAYPGRFLYSTRGPDFVDTTTGEMLELTTPGQVGSHLARPGYANVTICTYVLPTC